MGSFAITCSTSSGVTLCRAMCPAFWSSHSNWPPRFTYLYSVHTRCTCRNLLGRTCASLPQYTGMWTLSLQSEQCGEPGVANHFLLVLRGCIVPLCLGLDRELVGGKLWWPVSGILATIRALLLAALSVASDIAAAGVEMDLAGSERMPKGPLGATQARTLARGVHPPQFSPLPPPIARPTWPAGNRGSFWRSPPA